jgi:predicted nucleic acid-binding protein
MLRVYLDTNVLIDLFQSDRPYHAASLGLFKAAAAGKIELVVASITILNTVYVLRKADKPAEIAAKMKGVLRFLQVANSDHACMVAAMDSGWMDLEDAVQYHTALASGRIDFFVTGDNTFQREVMSISVINPQRAIAALR